MAPVSIARGDEVVRTLNAQLPSGAGFSVEKLVGTMRIREADVAAVTAVATVYAESQSLADAVRFEPVSGSDGSTLRVRYPYDRIGTFRYRPPGEYGDALGLSFSSSSAYHYDGRDVKVNSGRGTRIHADVEVQVPRGDVNARFLNLVGLVEAEGLHGKMRFEVASADLRLARLQGDLELAGSSATSARATSRADGSRTSQRGRAAGRLRRREPRAPRELRRLRHPQRQGAEDRHRDELRRCPVPGRRRGGVHCGGDLGRHRARGRGQQAGVGGRLDLSGDVTLRLPRDASFEATARQSSGDMRVDFSDGSSVHKGDSLVGYRHGDHGARIRVRTSSGDFSLYPVNLAPRGGLYAAGGWTPGRALGRAEAVRARTNAAMCGAGALRRSVGRSIRDAVRGV